MVVILDILHFISVSLATIIYISQLILVCCCESKWNNTFSIGSLIPLVDIWF